MQGGSTSRRRHRRPVVLAQTSPATPTPLCARRSRRARSPARSSSASAAATAGSKGLQRPAGRRRRHDPLQPDRAATPRRTTTSCRRSTSRARNAELLAFLAAHTGVTATWAAGQKAGAGRRHGRRSARAARSATSSSPTSPRPASRSSPAHADARPRSPAARPASCSRRSPARRCPARTSPASAALLKAAAPDWTPGPDQVGADDLVGAGRRQGGRRHAGRSVRPRRRAHRANARGHPG